MGGLYLEIRILVEAKCFSYFVPDWQFMLDFNNIDTVISK